MCLVPIKHCRSALQEHDDVGSGCLRVEPPLFQGWMCPHSLHTEAPCSLLGACSTLSALIATLLKPRTRLLEVFWCLLRLSRTESHLTPLDATQGSALLPPMLGPEVARREVVSHPLCCGELANHEVNRLLEPTQSQETPCCHSEAVNGRGVGVCERGPKALGRGERREKQDWERNPVCVGGLGLVTGK